MTLDMDKVARDFERAFGASGDPSDINENAVLMRGEQGSAIYADAATLSNAARKTLDQRTSDKSISHSGMVSWAEGDVSLAANVAQDVRRALGEESSAEASDGLGKSLNVDASLSQHKKSIKETFAAEEEQMSLFSFGASGIIYPDYETGEEYAPLHRDSPDGLRADDGARSGGNPEDEREGIGRDASGDRRRLPEEEVGDFRGDDGEGSEHELEGLGRSGEPSRRGIDRAGDAGDAGNLRELFRAQSDLSPLARAERNVEAIKALLAMEARGDSVPTNEERAAMAGYSGWVGAPDAFKDPSALKGRWVGVAEALSDLLSDEEYADARATTLTACYTPMDFTDIAFSALRSLGLGNGESALEPGCGIGNFIGSVPDDMNLDFIGVECDSISSRIAQAVNSDARIVSARLEKCYISDDSFAVAVGNVPFANNINIDGESIHNWFIERSIKALRPGGIGIFITSRYTSDATSGEARKRIEEMADLVGMVRLPAEAFEGQGARGVVTDILAFRKRLDGEEPLDRGWSRTAPFEQGIRVNEYVMNHPECVIGEGFVGNGPYGPTYSVKAMKAGTIDNVAEAAKAELIRQLGVVHVNVSETMGEAKETPMVSALPAHQLRFEYTVLDGHPFYGNGDYVERVVVGTPTTRDAKERQLVALIELRDAVNETLAAERVADVSDEKVDSLIESLNKRYDEFRDKYGAINSTTNERLWAKKRDNLGWSRVEQLESEVNGEWVKSDIMKKRVIDPAPSVPDHVDHPTEAIALSLSKYGRLDGGYISQLTGVAEEDIPSWSGGAIIRDPETRNLLTDDDYLSGDLGYKLDFIASERARLEVEGERRATDEWRNRRGIVVATAVAGVAASKADNWFLDFLRDKNSLAPLIDSDGPSYVYPVHPMAMTYNKVSSWNRPSGINDVDLLIGLLWILEQSDCVEIEDRPIWNKFSNNFMISLPGKSWRRESESAWADVGKGDLILVAFDALEKAPLSDEHKGQLYALIIASIVDDERLKSPLDSSVLNSTLELDRETNGFRTTEYGGTSLILKNKDDSYKNLARAIGAHPHFGEWVLEVCRGNIKATDESYESYVEQRRAFTDTLMIRNHEKRIEEMTDLESRLRERLPERIALEDAMPSIGASWIPAKIYHKFMMDKFGIFDDNGYRLSVSLDGQGRWVVNGDKSIMSDEATMRWGTEKKNPAKVAMAAMNNSEIHIFKNGTFRNKNGEEIRVLDKEQTAAANELRSEINAEFQAWCLSDPDLKKYLTDTYNEKVNRKTRKSYEGSWLSLPGSNPEHTLRKHQKEAVARILLSDEGTIVAHAVGAGKTWTGAAACMEARRMGRAKKPMIVVPNNLGPQWHREFLRLYPDAKILCMDREDSRNTATVNSFLSRVQMGDWDAVIISQSRFDQIKLSPDIQRRYLNNRIQSLMRDTLELKATLSDKHPSVKAQEKILASLRMQLERLSKKSGEIDGFPFDELGVDMLYVDEAHAYKNLAIPNVSQYTGLNISASGRAENMLSIIRYLQEKGYGRNIVFATGTPVSNNMAELFNMERYVAPELMSRSGTDNFASWVNTFAEVTTEPEFRPEGGGYQMKEAIRTFKNIPELMAEVCIFMDSRNKDDLGLDTPDEKIVNVAVPMAEKQEEEQDQILESAEAIHKGAVSPEEDNMLALTTDGRKISLDPYLLHKGDDDYVPLEGEGKIWACCEKVHEIWEKTADAKGTQLVFCDTSANTSNEWNVQSRVKEILENQGIPGNEIEIMSKPGGTLSDAAKERIFEKMRHGDIRVLIGSTQTLGTGTNVQDLLVASHDLDCPWRPSDLEQRKGRIVRQGNANDEVTIYRYSTEGTFDTYMWQSVVRKAKFVNQIFSSGDGCGRTFENRDSNTLSYSEMLALSTGNQNVVDYFGYRNERQNLIMHKEAFEAAQAVKKNKLKSYLETTMTRAEKEYRMATENHELLLSASQKVNEALEADNQALKAKQDALRDAGEKYYRKKAELGRDERQWHCTINGNTCVTMEEANEAIANILYTVDLGKKKIVGEYMGTSIVLERRPDFMTGESSVWAGIMVGNENVSYFHDRPINSTKRGNTSALGQINTIIEKFADVEKIQRRYEHACAQRDDMMAAANMEWPGKKNLEEVTRKIYELCREDEQIRDMYEKDSGKKYTALIKFLPQENTTEKHIVKVEDEALRRKPFVA